MISSIASPILPPGTTRVFMCEINEPCSIANSREIDILQIAEMDHHKALVQRGIALAANGLEVSTVGTR